MKISQTTSFLLTSIKPFKLWIAGMLAITVIWAVFLSLRPYLLKLMTDRIAVNQSDMIITVLTWPIITYISLIVIGEIIFRLYDYIWLNLRPNLQKSIGLNLMSRMIDHSTHFYQNNFAGSLVNKVNDVIGGIPNILRTFVDKFFGDSLALLIGTYTLYNTSPKFALAFVIWTFYFLIVSIKFSSVGRSLSKNAANTKSKLIGCKVDILGNIKSVKLLAGKKREIIGLNNAFNKLIEATQGRDWFFLKVSAFQGGSFAVYQGICLWWIMIGLQNKEIMPGDFILILTINISLIQILWDLSYDINNFAEHIGNVDQGLSIILTPLEIMDTEKAKELNVVKGEIIFNNVKFHIRILPLFLIISLLKFRLIKK